MSDLHPHTFHASWLDVSWLDFPGWTDGTTWNGWEKPWFTKRVVDHYILFNDALRAYMSKERDRGSLASLPDLIVYDQVHDAFIVTDEDGTPTSLFGEDVGGSRLYSFAELGWVWEVIEGETCLVWHTA